MLKLKKKASHSAHKKHDHTDDAERILCELQERGYRITAPRRAIVDALDTARNPKSVAEIAKRTKIKEPSTVYRTLSELVKEGLVTEIQAGETAYFEVRDAHHDHAICDSCGNIEHVPCSSSTIPSTLLKSGWNVTAHDALWRGLCAKCS